MRFYTNTSYSAFGHSPSFSWRRIFLTDANPFYVRPLAAWSLGAKVFNSFFDLWSHWRGGLGHTHIITQEEEEKKIIKTQSDSILFYICLHNYKNFFSLSDINVIKRVIKFLHDRVKYWGWTALFLSAVWPLCLHECAKTMSISFIHR